MPLFVEKSYQIDLEPPELVSFFDNCVQSLPSFANYQRDEIQIIARRLTKYFLLLDLNTFSLSTAEERTMIAECLKEAEVLAKELEQARTDYPFPMCFAIKVVMLLGGQTHPDYQGVIAPLLLEIKQDFLSLPRNTWFSDRRKISFFLRNQFPGVTVEFFSQDLEVSTPTHQINVSRRGVGVVEVGLGKKQVNKTQGELLPADARSVSATPEAGSFNVAHLLFHLIHFITHTLKLRLIVNASDERRMILYQRMAKQFGLVDAGLVTFGTVIESENVFR